MSSSPVNTAPQRPESPPPSQTSAGGSLRLTPHVLWGSAWALTALLLSAYAFKRLFPGDLTDGDAMDYAQIARNIAEGHGFATSILRPLALSGFVTPDSSSGYTTPDISRAPLYPFALMLAFVAHGGHGGGNLVVLISLVFFLASAAAIYYLAQTIFPTEGRPWTALLSVGLYVLGGSALGFATLGLPVPLTSLVVSLFFIALFRSHETAGRAVPAWQVFVVGVLLGVCYLAQFSLLLLLLTALVYVFATRAPARAWTGVAMCLAGFLVVTLPWLIRTALVTHGNPFFTLLQYGIMADTPEYPGQSTIYRSVLPGETPFSFFFSHLSEMVRKAGRGLSYYQTHLTEAFPLLILSPALASLLWRFSDVRVGVLRGYVAASVFLLAIVTAFFVPSVGFLAPFAPIVTVLGVGFVFQLMGRQQWQPLSQRIVLWGWGTLMGLGLLGVLLGHVSSPPGTMRAGLLMLISPPLPPPLDTKAHDAIAGGAVLTDTPWEVAWMTSLPAIWLPRDNQAYEATVKGTQGAGKVPSAALLLTPNVAAYATADEAMPWVSLARDPRALKHRDQSVAAANGLPAVLKARAALALNMLATHDPRLGHINPALLKQQIAQAKAALPTSIAKAKSDAQSQFTATYGPISEVISDYVPVAQQPEAGGGPSTLFLRSDLISLSSTPMGANQ